MVTSSNNLRVGAMNIVAQFESEHEELLAILCEVFLELDVELLQKSGSAVLKQLEKLQDLLTNHLSMEDKIIYPAISANESSEMRNVARLLQDDFGELGALYGSFSKDWSTPAKIEEQPQVFANDAQILLALLTKRIHRENELLLPILTSIARTGAVFDK